MRRLVPLCTLLGVSWILPPPLHADDMGEGEARITARSDVTMAMESGPRTTSTKLSAMAKHLGTPLGAIKRCYADIVKETPEVAGHIDVDLVLPERGRLDVKLDVGELSSKQLRGCVTRAFEAMKLEESLRPASAKVKLDFTNSAANAASDVAARREEQAQVTLEKSEDGTLSSEDGTADGKVRFSVSGKDAAALTATHHAAAYALPRLLDCRRRSAKLDSPAGVITLRVVLSPNGKARIDARASTVKHPNAKTCTQTALRKAPFEKGAQGTLEVVVKFNE